MALFPRTPGGTHARIWNTTGRWIQHTQRRATAQFRGKYYSVILVSVFDPLLHILTSCNAPYVQPFSLKFKAAWAKDGYRSYLEQDNEVCCVVYCHIDLPGGTDLGSRFCKTVLIFLPKFFTSVLFYHLHSRLFRVDPWPLSTPPLHNRR